MAEELNKQSDGAPKAGRKPKAKPAKSKSYDLSTIAFPYMDMDAGISVVRAMLNAGGVALTRDQLAGTMNLVANSGNFVTKVATAKMFGLVENPTGKYEITNLGFSILDSDEKRVRAAKAEAFLNVPLYKRAYDEFRGKQLPPRPHGLEQAFVRFGVSPKQKQRVRLAFDKSATQAGFFPNGTDRLIEPIIGTVSPLRSAPMNLDMQASDQPDDFEPVPRARVPEPSALHPFIQGLIDALPAPGTNWAVEGRSKWLQAAANNFDLMYKGDGAITIIAKAAHAQSDKETQA